MSDIPRASLRWPKAYRIINSRHPPIAVFERVADPEDWDALYAVEQLTNPRVRQEWGEISLVPIEERPAGGQAVSWVMAAFTHVDPRRPTRFGDGTYGVYYAARCLETSVRETAYHFGRFLAATREPLGTTLELRVLISEQLKLCLHDIRRLDSCKQSRAILDPDSYLVAQQLAASLRTGGSNGLVYPSVRHPSGTCIALFRAQLVPVPIQGPHLRYHFDGQRIDRWFNFRDSEWHLL